MGTGPEDKQGIGDDQQEATVTKTFKLTLNGDVPEGETFSVGYDVPPAEVRLGVTFCGADSGVECVGGGTIYTQSVELEQGSTIEFDFVRSDASTREPGGGDPEIFLSGTEPLNTDLTSSAYYTFDTGDTQQGGDTGQQMPEELPETGAGGLASGATIQVGTAAAGLVMLVGSGYAVIRRR